MKEAEETQALVDMYEKSGDPYIADHLIESLDAARHARYLYLRVLQLL